MKPQFEELPFNKRPDLSPYLIHLTKRSKKRDAFKNLLNILKTGEIRGSTVSGYIKGGHQATCFLDVPFTALKYLLNKNNTNPSRPRYEPFGIFTIKTHAYKKGCRPVLYLSKTEERTVGVAASELWRVVRFEPARDGWICWLHEREWRCNGSFQVSESPGVVVKNSKYAKRLQDAIKNDPSAFKCIPRCILPLSVVCQGLVY